jgi:hypothetical protein
MTLFTKTQTEQLITNCQAQIVRMNSEQPDIDFTPVVKLFTPDAQCTWLLTELGLDDIAFGLCDLGMGTPELGFVSMHELRDLRGPTWPSRRARHALRRRQDPVRLRQRSANTGASSLAGIGRRPSIGGLSFPFCATR